MLGMFTPGKAPLADQVPYWGFALPDVVLTMSGQLLFFARIRHAAIDARDPADLDVINRSWQKLLGTVEPPHRAFIVFTRPEMELPDDYDRSDDIAGLAQRKRLSFVCSHVRRMQSTLVVAFDPELTSQVDDDQSNWVRQYIRHWAAERSRQPHLNFYLRELIDDAIADCRTRFQGLSSLVKDGTPLEPMSSVEIASLLHYLVNQGQGVFEPTRKPQRYGLNWRLAAEDVSFERTHMVVGNRLVGLYSLALPPQASAANSLGELYSMQADLSIVLEWRGVDRYDATKRIRAVQKHYNNQRWSLWSAVNETEGSSMAIEDASSGAAVEQLHRASLELETHGVAFGEFALSISAAVDSRKELDELGAQIQRVVLHQDGKVVQERAGQPVVWFQRLPGQARKPFARPVFLSSGQAASLAPLFGAPTGYETCKHLRKPPLTWFETRWQTPYGYDLFGGHDVGHTAIFGATGSGKSFTLNFLLMQALQYNPRVVILDLGGSYRWITRFLGGSYISMKPDDVQADAPALQPFSLEEGERTFAFLEAWIVRLLDLGGYKCDPSARDDIRRRIQDIYKRPREQRTLGALKRILNKPMWPALNRWVDDGPWAKTFDGPPSDGRIGDNTWQVIDLEGAKEHKDWCTAALFFLFERLRLVIDDDSEIDRVKLMVVDEAWMYLQDEVVLNSLMEAAKTWRKRNAALIMATQSVGDVSTSQQALALLEMLPTKLFLANPDFPASAADVLQLTPAQLETIRGLESKQEMYLHRATEQVVLRLGVDPESYWLYTSSPTDAAIRSKMVAAYGLAPALVRLGAGLRTVGDDPNKAVVA